MMQTRNLPTPITSCLQPDDRATAERLADELAQVMIRLHGGTWLVQVDHNRRFVFVLQHVESSPCDS